MSKETVAESGKKSDKPRVKKEKIKLQTKLVIRHLPPTMTEGEFLQQTDPLPEHDLFYFVEADWSLGQDATCRAYITLKSLEEVFLFRDRFDGYVFVDSKGVEYACIVEFAPFQGITKNRARGKDNKVNTIEQEAHYQQFLAKLEEDRELAAKRGESKLEFSLDRKKEEKVTSTPLLQYLAQKKEKRREDQKKKSEEKRRLREEEREKNRQIQNKVRMQAQAEKAAASTQEAAKKNKGNDKSANNSKSNSTEGRTNKNANKEEQMNARTKRRSERNHRRHEEYVKRRREEAEKLAKQKLNVNVEQNKKQQNAEQPAEPKQNEEVKKTSEKTDKCMDIKPFKHDDSKTIKVDEEKLKKDEIIKSLGEHLRSLSLEGAATPSVSSKKCVTDKTDKTEAETAKNNRSTTTRETAATTTKNAQQNRRQTTAMEERRIRNKDRPSIAIYQPKIRTRGNDESDAVKDARSNPTSDVEHARKEEPRVKKVSRYSERRNERRMMQENKLKLEATADTEAERHRIHKSKSYEDESIAKSSETVMRYNEN